MIWHCSGSRERSASSDSMAPVGPQGSLRVASRTRRSTYMNEGTGVQWQGTGVSAKCEQLYDTLCRLSWSCYSIARQLFSCALGAVSGFRLEARLYTVGMCPSEGFPCQKGSPPLMQLRGRCCGHLPLSQRCCNFLVPWLHDCLGTPCMRGQLHGRRSMTWHAGPPLVVPAAANGLTKVNGCERPCRMAVT